MRTKEGRTPSYSCISQRDKAYKQKLDSQPPAMCMCIARHSVNAYAQHIQLFVCTDLYPSPPPFPPANARAHTHVGTHLSVLQPPDKRALSVTHTHTCIWHCLHMCRRRTQHKPSLPDRAIFCQEGTACMVFQQGTCS